MSGLQAHLGTAVAQYLETATTVFSRERLAARPQGGPYLLLTSDQLLLRGIALAEKAPEFTSLVRSTAAAYCPEGLVSNNLGRLPNQVRTFFRRAGIYAGLFEGEPYPSAEVIERYRLAFEATTQTITHLAPIEWVYILNPA
jgi:hypothetical protein